MWDWSHFKVEGWLAHSKGAARLSGLLLLSSLTMIIHLIVPFWQQPVWLRVESVATAMLDEMERRKG